MDNPSVRAIGSPRKTGKEDAAAEEVKPPHAVTAWLSVGTGMETLCGGSHNSGWKCFALVPCRNLAEPETESVDDI